jgi:thiamine-phosphate pyrophosphorylase
VRVLVVTDRRLCGDLLERVAAIARIPGVAFQVREKDLDGGPLLELARAVIARSNGAPVWINDRVDVARLAGAHGVHLPEAGMSIADARALAAELAIGVSRHSADAALAAVGADVIQLGPCFATPGKPTLGLAPLAIDTPATVVAVGGIVGPEQARAAIAAGADAVAVIRAAWTSADPAAAIAAIADACNHA